jgi:hypothetical protein
LNNLIDTSWQSIGHIIGKCIELDIPIGYIIMPGEYYDCGTFEEYFKFIKNET